MDAAGRAESRLPPRGDPARGSRKAQSGPGVIASRGLPHHEHSAPAPPPRRPKGRQLRVGPARPRGAGIISPAGLFGPKRVASRGACEGDARRRPCLTAAVAGACRRCRSRLPFARCLGGAPRLRAPLWPERQKGAMPLSTNEPCLLPGSRQPAFTRAAQGRQKGAPLPCT